MTPSPCDQSLYAHIDRLRGMFAVCVMVGHSIDLAYGAGTPDYAFATLMPIRPLLGFVWVVGFIVLSGYCVTRSCVRASHQSFVGFAALRASRLFPLLWVAVILAVVVETSVRGSAHRPPVWTFGIDSTHVWLNLLGLGGFFGQYGSLAPAYTLSYELAFYLLWAVAWFTTRQRPAAAMIVALGLSSGLFLGLRNLLPFGRAILGDFVLLLFQCWCIGAVVAFWLPRLAGIRSVVWFAPLRWGILVFVMWFGFSTAQMPRFEATAVSAIYYVVLSLAFAFLTVGFVARGATISPTRLDGWLGTLSYPLFITHGPVIIGLATLYRRVGLDVPFGLYLLALIIPALIAGAVFAAAIDVPVMALRKRARSRTAREMIGVQQAGW